MARVLDTLYLITERYTEQMGDKIPRNILLDTIYTLDKKFEKDTEGRSTLTGVEYTLRHGAPRSETILQKLYDADKRHVIHKQNHPNTQQYYTICSCPSQDYKLDLREDEHTFITETLKETGFHTLVFPNWSRPNTHTKSDLTK